MSNVPNEFLIKSLSLVRYGLETVRYDTSSMKVRENLCKRNQLNGLKKLALKV